MNAKATCIIGILGFFFGFYFGINQGEFRISPQSTQKSATHQKIPNRHFHCNIASGRKLAVAQLQHHHTEQIAFVLDYARVCSHVVTVYVSTSNSNSAMSLNVALFKDLNIDVRQVHLIATEHQLYDAIFFITPDDPFDGNFRENIAHKSIYATHISHRDGIKRWQTLRLFLTPLAGYPFVIPAFFAPHVPAKERSHCIVMLGTIHAGNQNVKVIFDFLQAASSLGYHSKIFTRRFDSNVPVPTSVQIIIDAKAEIVFEAVQHSRFVLIFPLNTSLHVTDRLTGVLPLAISTSTPIITTSQFAEIYGLDHVHGVLNGDTKEIFDVLQRSTEEDYRAMIDSMFSYRNAVLMNNYAAIEIALVGIADVAAMSFGDQNSTTGNLLPLSRYFYKRLTPSE